MRSLAMAVIMAASVTAQTAALAEKSAREVTSFDVVVKAPYTETAKLFGPEGERVWAGKHWNPRFIFPRPGRDEQGAVFTIRHGALESDPLEAVWVIARHDVEARQFQYVYFIPSIMVCTIDVSFTQMDVAVTKVHVTYTRTAVSAEGDAHVAAMAEGDRRAGVEWQAAIDRYLSDRH